MQTCMTHAFSLTALALSLTLVAAGCAVSAEDDTAGATAGEEIAETSSELRIGGGLNAEGDACTVRTNPDGTKVPGKETGLECCSTSNPSDCVVILKPLPKAFYSLAR